MVDSMKDRIIQRVRKLLNLASDEAAFDGEITAAMGLAEKLMNEHHLERADVEAAEPEDSRTETVCGKSEAVSRGVAITDWELVLGRAVNALIGTTNWYRSGKDWVPQGVFGKKVPRTSMTFYGPAEDAALAAELFEEWSAVIATLAVGKYGGCHRGDGRVYAKGFASALQDKAEAAKRARYTIVTVSTTALVHVGGGTLGQVLDAKKELAANWLRTVAGVRLGSWKGPSQARGSGDAYSAGREDGNRADFTATRKRKLT